MPFGMKSDILSTLLNFLIVKFDFGHPVKFSALHSRSVTKEYYDNCHAIHVMVLANFMSVKNKT